MHARYCHLKFRRTLWVCQKLASWVWRKVHGVSKLLGSMYVRVRSYVIVAFCSRLKHACSCIHLFLSHDIKQGRVWFIPRQSFGQESEKTVQKKEESPEPLSNRTGLERSVLAETKPRAKKVQKHIVCSGSAYFPIIYGYKLEGIRRDNPSYKLRKTKLLVAPRSVVNRPKNFGLKFLQLGLSSDEQPSIWIRFFLVRTPPMLCWNRQWLLWLLLLLLNLQIFKSSCISWFLCWKS